METVILFSRGKILNIHIWGGGGCPGKFWHGGFCPEGLRPGVYVPEQYVTELEVNSIINVKFSPKMLNALS